MKSSNDDSKDSFEQIKTNNKTHVDTWGEIPALWK